MMGVEISTAGGFTGHFRHEKPAVLSTGLWITGG
jgi:hypothetical protein